MVGFPGLNTLLDLAVRILDRLNREALETLFACVRVRSCLKGCASCSAVGPQPAPTSSTRLSILAATDGQRHPLRNPPLGNPPPQEYPPSGIGLCCKLCHPVYLHWVPSPPDWRNLEAAVSIILSCPCLLG